VAYRPTLLTDKQQPLHCFCSHNTNTQVAANFTMLPKLTKLLPRKTPKGFLHTLGWASLQHQMSLWASFSLTPRENPPCLTFYNVLGLITQYAQVQTWEKEQQLGSGKESTTHAHTHIHPFPQYVTRGIKEAKWEHRKKIEAHLEDNNRVWKEIQQLTDYKDHHCGRLTVWGTE